MIAAAVMSALAVAVLCFYAKAWCEKMEAESDPVAAEFWEDETRAMAWRWLARKRKSQARRKAKARHRLGQRN